VILFESLLVLCSSLRIVDVKTGVILISLKLISEFGLLLLAETFPVVFDELVDLGG
jgi:hypothetical protein